MILAPLVLTGLLLWVLATPSSHRHDSHRHDSHRHERSSHDHEPGLGGHQGAEGLLLGAVQAEETVTTAPPCPPSAPVRSYQVVTIQVEITLNRYLDYDPEGRMFVLEEDLARVRQEEAQNRAARADRADPAVTLGLQGDGIQPLILRINQGECLQIALSSELPNGEPASFHLHGSSLYLPSTGAPAIHSNPDVVVRPGDEVTYRWWVRGDEPEGTHYFHSHGNTRLQTGHGLFGAVIVEPSGSLHLDPLSGAELRSGWAAIIQDPDGSDFREFAIIYHEIGNERYRHRDKSGRLVPFVDPFSDAYKPGGRALNYRSEPFMNRLTLQQQTEGRFDSSLAYSSYAFGDPATPVARSYLGDPVKQRIVHGGSEVFHVHHVHGGAIRWRRQPQVEPNDFDSGLQKHPPLLPTATERIDSQAIGPSEQYDAVSECGSGGCQQSAGDLLIHCHVAHHYLAGMWMIWRVYNTLQDGSSSQDDLPPLQSLPDRQGNVRPAVTSVGLIGRTVEWQGQAVTISTENLPTWVEGQLPPQGIPKGYDASVLDWQRQDILYLSEPESGQSWPGYASQEPGTRPPFYFDPLTGKLAYPFLRPHFGKRPPFAPNHGPAPFLDPFATGLDPPPPGASGPGSLCPTGTNLKTFTVHALSVPVPLNERLGLIDPVGQLFVLKEQEDAVRSGNDLKVPLAIRANAGEDCIDVLLKSEMKDSRENAFFSKVSLHIHFVQFDAQGSDGVTTGFNYEQAIRPFTVEGEALVAPASAGANSITLGDANRFQPGILVGVGMDQTETFEIAKIEELNGNEVVLEAPLRFDHEKDEIVSTEFLRHRWYPDVQFGTAYFHDHVDALTSWEHGLFGALIAEPPGSSYHDPYTGEAIASGPLADIHTDNRVSADITGSFRELVLFIQDDNPLTREGDSSGSTFNLRVEPLDTRMDDPARLFSSALHGDPATPIFEAFLGDPLVIRSLVAATNDVHTLQVDGHWFRLEPFSNSSPPINTIHLGISERYDLSIPKAGGPQGRPGDYLYRNGRGFALREGSWGLLRVHGPDAEPRLQKLPNRQTVPTPSATICPEASPQKVFDVVALETPLPMLGGELGKIFVLEEDKAALHAGTRTPEPLVLHVNVGDCLLLRVHNETTDGPVSVHADLLAFDPQTSLGIATGFTTSQISAPGETTTYTFFAHPDVGETVALIHDGSNLLENPRLGLYGAVIVGPPGTTYTDPMTGADVTMKTAWRVDAHPPNARSYRDFTLFLQDEDPVIGTAIMPYSEEVEGVLALNYQLEPLAQRLERSANTASLFESSVHGQPATPIIEAFPGDPIKLHVLVPSSTQAHVFSIEGHRWPLEPQRANSDLLNSVQVGSGEATTMELEGGAGPPGEYLYGDHREPYREGGLWGVMQIHNPNEGAQRLIPLPDR